MSYVIKKRRRQDPPMFEGIIGGIPTEEEEAREETRNEWIKTLPDSLENGEEVDKNFFYIADPWGNRLIDLPKEPVKDIQAWFEEQDLSGCEE